MGEILTSVKLIEPILHHFIYPHIYMKYIHMLLTDQICALIHSFYALYFLTVCLPKIFYVWANEMNVFSTCLKQKIKLTTFSPRKPSSKEKRGTYILPFFSMEHFKPIQILEFMENYLANWQVSQWRGTPHLDLLWRKRGNMTSVEVLWFMLGQDQASIGSNMSSDVVGRRTGKDMN